MYLSLTWADFTRSVTTLPQADGASVNQVTSANATATETAVCQKCLKTAEQTPFSKKQKKRLQKGQPAMCKACSGHADSNASGKGAGAALVQPRVKKVTRLFG